VEETAGTLIRVLQGVAEQHLENFVPLVLKIAHTTEDPDSRLLTLRALRDLGQSPNGFESFANDSSPLVQMEMLEWFGQEHSPSLDSAVRNHLHDSSKAFPGIFGALPLSDTQKDWFRRELSSSDPHSAEAAASVIAMIGSAPEVEALLRSPYVSIRKATVSYICANAKFDEIFQGFKATPRVPDFVDEELTDLRLKRESLQSNLTGFPPAQRAGRLALHLDFLEKKNASLDGYYFWVRGLLINLARARLTSPAVAVQH
jgi:hypothetical protein